MKTFFKFLLQYSSFKYILEASVKALEQFGKEYRSMKTITNCNHNQRIEKSLQRKQFLMNIFLAIRKADKTLKYSNSTQLTIGKFFNELRQQFITHDKSKRHLGNWKFL